MPLTYESLRIMRSEVKEDLRSQGLHANAGVVNAERELEETCKKHEEAHTLIFGKYGLPGGLSREEFQAKLKKLAPPAVEDFFFKYKRTADALLKKS